MPEKVILKKYANRRLYDTERSAYVTLNEVAELIKTGRQVEVIDAKTKEDVTAFILTQILLEEAIYVFFRKLHHINLIRVCRMLNPKGSTPPIQFLFLIFSIPSPSK